MLPYWTIRNCAGRCRLRNPPALFRLLIEKLRYKRYSKSTINTYVSLFADFVKFFNGTALAQITEEQIRHYQLYLVDKRKVSAGTQNHPVVLYISSMYFYVYVLLSEKDNKFYTGYTSNLRERLRTHQEGKVLSTQHRLPIQLVYFEGCLDKRDAMRREKYLKSGNGKLYLKSRLKYFSAS